MQSQTVNNAELDPKTLAFYVKALKALNASKVHYLVGGTYAFGCFTGISRNSKDLDIFVRPQDCDRTLAVLSKIGCKTELSSPHWLGKAFYGEDFIDIIFNSASANSEVDERWFERAVKEKVFDIPVSICSAEDMIWQKAYIMDRYRFDGADIAHLLLARAQKLDWSYLLDRFGSDWRVLFSHLILFGFIYPKERSGVPNWVMEELSQRLEQETNAPAPNEKLCQGTLLSAFRYRVDTQVWGYKDARLHPTGNLTQAEIAEWTAALEREA